MANAFMKSRLVILLDLSFSSDQISVLQQAEGSGGSVTNDTLLKLRWDQNRFVQSMEVFRSTLQHTLLKQSPFTSALLNIEDFMWIFNYNIFSGLIL